MLFSNEVRPGFVAPPLSLVGICSVSFDFQTKKKGEYKSEKNVRKMRTLLFKRTYTQNVKRKKMTVIFKKKRKKRNLLFILSFFESL